MLLCVTVQQVSLCCCTTILHSTWRPKIESSLTCTTQPACLTDEVKCLCQLTGLFSSHSRLQNQEPSALLQASQLTPAPLFLPPALPLLIQAAFQAVSCSLIQLLTLHQMRLFELLPLRQPRLAGTTRWALSLPGQSGSPQNWRTCKLHWTSTASGEADQHLRQLLPVPQSQSVLLVS